MPHLIIAEKPSLERNIMAAIGSRNFQKQNGYYEGKDYIITHTFGHLFGLIDIEEYLPKDVREEKRGWTLDGLPFCPKQFRYDFKKDPKTRKPDASAKKQFSVIKELVNRNDVDMIIHAGDADREGELIINHILDACHNKKPVMRLWLPEQTEETIAYELKHLKNNQEFANVHAEGEARTYIDWLYGVNLTRLATLKSGNFLRVGRVITPIVKAIYDRDMEIEHFVPEPYLVLKSKEATKGVAIELTGKTKFSGENRTAEARKMAELYNQATAVVKDVKKEKKTIGPGKLYSLSKLQGVLGKQYKMSMKESLAIIQKLYEAGYVTYPRTNTEYLACQESGKINKVISLLQKQGYQFNSRQLDILEEAMHRGIDVKDFGNPNISPGKMRLLMEAKAKGIDISLLSDPDFLTEQIVFCIKELEQAQKHGYDIRPVVDKRYHVSQMKELSGAIKQGLDISDMLSGDYPADYIYHKKQEQIEQELDFNSVFSRKESYFHDKKEFDDMNKHTKTLFGPATERKLPFEEQIKNAELKREQQILNHTREKTKEQEQAVI